MIVVNLEKKVLDIYVVFSCLIYSPPPPKKRAVALDSRVEMSVGPEQRGPGHRTKMGEPKKDI